MAMIEFLRLLLVPLAWADPVAPPAPEPATPPAAIEFGTLPRFADQECRITLTELDSNNSGYAVHTDCVCLRGEIRNSPGAGTADLMVQLHTCDALGEAHRSIRVVRGPQQLEILRIPVHYRVVPDLYADPPFVALGLVADEPVQAEFLVRTAGTKTIQILAAGCDDPAVNLTPRSTAVSAGQPVRIDVTFQPNHPPREFRSTIWVETDSADIPRLRVPLFGELGSGVSAEIHEIVFDGVPLGSAPKHTITLKYDAGCEIGEVRTTNDSLRIDGIARSGSQVVLTLSPSERLGLGDANGFVTLGLQAPQRRTLRLAYRIHVDAQGLPHNVSALADPGKPAQQCTNPCGN